MQPERKAPVPSARSLLARRSAARRTVLLATGVTIFLLSLALSAVVALGLRGPIAATRATLSSSSAADSSVTVSATPAKDATAQDVGVRGVIHESFAGVPVLVTHHRVAATGRTPTMVTWTIAPNARTITAAELGSLAAGFSHLEARVDASSAAHSPGAQVSGRGPQTVSEMRVAIAAVDIVLPIPITVLSLAGIIALLLCARLLGATRENESRLVRARGGSIRTLVLADTSEIVLPAVVGAVAGSVIAEVTLAFSLGPPTGLVEAGLAPLAIIVATVIVTAVSGASSARAATGMPRPSSGRAILATSLSLAVLLVAVSSIAAWRFLQYGTPVVGRPQDAAAVLAPALIPCTAALLALLLFYPVTGWLQRRSARGIRFVRVLPARTLHRNPRLFAGPIALLVISIATATTAAGYASTWTGFLADSTRLVTGSDVRASFGGEAEATDATSVLGTPAYARLPGVRAAVPVLREAASLGDENVTAIGFSVDHAAAIVGPSSSVIDVQQLVTALTPRQDPLDGIQLPGGATALTLTVATSSTSGGPGSVLATLWLADPLGDLAPLVLPAQPAGPAAVPEATHTVTLPPAGPWRVVAIDAEVTATHQIRGFDFGVSSLSAATAAGETSISVVSPDSWAAQNAVFNNGTSSAGRGGSIGFARATIRGGTNTSVRVMPPGSPIVPVIVSRSLAVENQMRIGDSIDVEGQWASFGARVAGIVPLVPGVTSQASLMGDLRSIDNGWLRSSEQVPALHELWIAGSPTATVASEAEAVDSGRITASTGSVSRAFVSGAVVGLWIGAAGSAACAIVTLIASLASVVRRRSREVGILRALGVTARDQGRMRRSEILIVLLFGLVVGALAGVAMLAIVVETLARSSTPEAPTVLPLVLRFDPVPLAILVGALDVASAIVVARYVGSIRAAARVAKP